MFVVYIFALCLSFTVIHAQDGNSPYCFPPRVFISTIYRGRVLSDFYVDYENEYMVEDQKDSFFGTHNYFITDVKNSKRYSKRNGCKTIHLGQLSEYFFQCVPSSAKSSSHDDQMNYWFSAGSVSITIITNKETGQPVKSVRYRRTGTIPPLQMNFLKMTSDIQDHYAEIYIQMRDECQNHY